ncbi:EamA family transporter [Hollandina sp. SP2]
MRTFRGDTPAEVVARIDRTILDIFCHLEIIEAPQHYWVKHGGGMWVLYAVLSAFFAALTSILAKIGVENINSHVATAIRTIVVLLLSWTILFITGNHHDLVNIGRKNLLFLLVSGIATGLSWLCYYRALQIGEASKVIPIDKFSLVFGMVLAWMLLKEPISIKTIIGGTLITVGTLVLIF